MQKKSRSLQQKDPSACTRNQNDTTQLESSSCEDINTKNLFLTLIPRDKSERRPWQRWSSRAGHTGGGSVCSCAGSPRRARGRAAAGAQCHRSPGSDTAGTAGSLPAASQAQGEQKTGVLIEIFTLNLQYLN